MTFESAPPRSVYIVDDDAAFCRSVERVMRSVGMTAISFASGPAFLKAAPDLADGCVILDVRMPGMGGLELQKQLKLIGFRLPIIVMTLKGVEPARPLRRFGWRYWRNWRLPMSDRRPSIRRAMWSRARC
jgi:CheY-like chemotaxis protein